MKTPTEALAAMAADAKPSPLDKLPIEDQFAAATILDHQAKPTPASAVADIDAFAAMLAEADAGMWATARLIAEGEEPEPAALPRPEPTPGPEPVALQVVRAYSEPPKPDMPADAEMPEFDEALLAKLFANLAAHGKTLEDLAA